MVTGPNMGGKSSTVRMVALICIMGQVRIEASLGCSVVLLIVQLIFSTGIQQSPCWLLVYVMHGRTNSPLGLRGRKALVSSKRSSAAAPWYFP